jgi:head-tail adaptor
MGAGDMTQLVRLRRKTETLDGAGGFTHVWGDVPNGAQVWAAVTFKGAREGITEDRMTASQMTTFEIYARTDLTELDAILWQGEHYNIRAIRRYGPERLTMWIDAERGVAE